MQQAAQVEENPRNGGVGPVSGKYQDSRELLSYQVHLQHMGKSINTAVMLVTETRGGHRKKNTAKSSNVEKQTKIINNHLTGHHYNYSPTEGALK